MDKRNTPQSWLDTAVSGIRFGPDRARVRIELLQHMEDKASGLQRSFPDIDPLEAQERAITAMGDPEEVRAALAKVHKPWLGWLWQASRVALWVAVCITALYNLTVPTDYRTSLWGSGSTPVYHRLGNGDRAQLGQYTVQITGAAYLDRPEYDDARDNLQVALRVSSPRFWERVEPDAVYRALSAAGPNGEWHSMDRVRIARYTAPDGLGGSVAYQFYWVGAELCRWGIGWREFAVYVPAEGWRPGERVTLRLDAPVGSVTLSVPVTEKAAVR